MITKKYLLILLLILSILKCFVQETSKQLGIDFLNALKSENSIIYIN